jgi:two-component system, NarL family, nitrate/nitrite response regulator NarL
MFLGSARGDHCTMVLRCLIVDDSSHFLGAARSLLEREGLAVVGVASTSEEALAQIEEVRPDLVLVDIDLGKESGFELARRIHNETSLGSSEVILISTYAEEDLADLIDATPAAGFLSKAHLSARAIREIVGSVGDSNGPRGR